MLNTVGNSPNVAQIVAAELLGKAKKALQEHKHKWTGLKKITEDWLAENKLHYFPNKVSATYWVRLPIADTRKWVDEQTIPKHSLAVVSGTFFLFRDGYDLAKSNMIRLGLGAINPEGPMLNESLNALETALKRR